jgi:hypothetical protein
VSNTTILGGHVQNKAMAKAILPGEVHDLSSVCLFLPENVARCPCCRRKREGQEQKAQGSLVQRFPEVSPVFFHCHVATVFHKWRLCH